jgi:hypothetical protein
MSWVEHGGPMGEMRNAYKVLVTKPEGRRDEKVILKLVVEKQYDIVGWIHLAELRNQ